MLAIGASFPLRTGPRERTLPLSQLTPPGDGATQPTLRIPQRTPSRGRAVCREWAVAGSLVKGGRGLLVRVVSEEDLSS